MLPKNTASLFLGTYLRENIYAQANTVPCGEEAEPLCPQGPIPNERYSIFVGNTPAITLSGTGVMGNPILATLKLSELAGNSLVINEDGLYVSAPAAENITVIEQNITTLQEYITNIEQNITTIQQDITNVQQDITNINNYTISINGNSKKLNEAVFTVDTVNLYNSNGALTANRFVTLGAYNLSFSGTRTTGIFDVTNNDTGIVAHAIRGTATNASGVIGTTTGGSGVWGNSTGGGTGVLARSISGVGLSADSDTGIAIRGTSKGVAGYFHRTNTVANAVSNVIELKTGHSSSAEADGFGGRISMSSTYQGSEIEACAIDWKSTNVASGIYNLEFYTANSSLGLGRKLAIAGNGKLTLDTYGAATHWTDTYTYSLGVNSTGQVVEISKTTLQAAITNGSTLTKDNNIRSNYNLVFYNQTAGTILLENQVTSGTRGVQVDSFSASLRNSVVGGAYSLISANKGSSQMSTTQGQYGSVLQAFPSYTEINSNYYDNVLWTYFHTIKVLNNEISFNSYRNDGVTSEAQTLKVVLTGNLPTYDDNTAAASLTTGQLYRTSTGQLMIKY